MKIHQESTAMRIMRLLGFERVAWSLRRIHCPVSRNAFVLEVGSGGNPYARANVLLDAYEETKERHWVPLIKDRPTVLGFVEKLPFKDNSFDFVIASHVLEHSANPEQFILELQRVAKAGYIEVPDAFMERVNPYTDHRLEITCIDNKLIITKKSGPIVDRRIVELYENKVKPYMTSELMPKRPFAFHVRYYWEKKISYEIVNPGTNASWKSPNVDNIYPYPALSIKARIQSFMLDAARLLLSQRKRNRNIDLLNILKCPNCGCEEMLGNQDNIKCSKCEVIYSVKKGVPLLYPQSS